MMDVAIDSGIAVLTMVHGKANTLDIEFCNALSDRLEELVRSDAKAIVLTGQGRIFSAGVNLKRVSAEGADYIRAFLPTLHRLYETAFNLPKPVVAAINGHAVAGGAVLACCADRRIMAKDSGRIGITELQVGVPFPLQSYEVVRFAVPPRYLPEFMLTGATYPTDAALERGWVDELCEAGDLIGRAKAVATQFAAISPSAFAQAKKQLRQLAAENYARSGVATDEAVTKIWTAPEALASIRDYVARTLKA
jgi:enoyl-CoA hydratase